MRIALLLSTILLLTSAEQLYQKITLNDPRALCLDGSPGAYYLTPGDPTKILLFFEGGGWCGDDDLSSTVENCYQRSKTGLGSSLLYPATVNFS